jgi:type VI secretion system protein ImpK
MGATFDSIIKGKTLDVDLGKAGSIFGSLNALCTDLYLIVMNISPDVDMGTEDDIRRILKHYVDQFDQNCDAVNVDREKREYVKYALVALIDEKILKLPAKWSDPWRTHMLQLDYFDNMVAGERFYESLNTLLERPSRYYDAIEIYYLCLCLGFKGKYLDKPDKLKAIIKKLPKIIFTSRPAASKPATIPKTKEKKARQIIPNVPTWLIASVTAAAIVILWVGTVVATRHFSLRELQPSTEMVSQQHESDKK